MRQRARLAALCLVLTATANGHGVETYEMIPADALGGVACKSIAGLVKKSDQLVKDAEIKLPEVPAELCKQLFAALGIQTGLDTKRGCSVVVVNRKHVGAEIGLRNLDQYIVVTLPLTDLDAMAKNFGLDKGKLKPETMTTVEPQRAVFTRVYARGQYVYLGSNERSILSVAKGKPVGDDLTPARRKTLAEADCLCHLGTSVWGDLWKDLLRNTESVFEEIKGDAERKTMRELLDSLAAVQHVLGTCRLDGGFGCSCLCVFPKEGAETAKKFLTALRAGDGGSSLAGLPEGNVVAALAARGDGAQNGHIARLLIDLVVRSVLESNRVFGPADRPALLAVFNEVWPRLQGSRFALYKTDSEQKLGLFSALGILDVEDPERFVAQLRLLTRLGSADGLDLTSEAGKEKTAAEIEALIKDLGSRRFQARESATARLLLAGEQVLPFLEKALQSMDLETKRRAERIKREIVQAAEDRRKELLAGNFARGIKPSFVFPEKTEKLEGFDVWTVGVKLTKRDAATAPQLRQLLGPDWARVRVAVQGKQVVILTGSDLKLFGEALRNLKEGKPGLASATALTAQAKQIHAGRKIEMHFSTAMGIALATAADLEKPGQVPPKPPLTTVAFTVEPDLVQCDLWLPVPEIKVIAKSAQ